MTHFSTSATCTKGALPERNLYDIHCPLMGGQDYRFNYLSSACRERQLLGSCTEKNCERRVNLVRPGVVQVSSVTTKQAKEMIEKQKKVETVTLPIASKEEKQMSDAKVCVDCSDPEKKIVGRGLCTTCYFRHKKAGTLDEFPKGGGSSKHQAADQDNLGCGGEHQPSEDCLLCAQCGQCCEDLDMNDVCIDCGGVDENLEATVGSDPVVDTPGLAAEMTQGQDMADDKLSPEEVKFIVCESQEDPRIVRLEFWPRDKDLFAALSSWASEERRSIEDQILYILDNVVFERNQEHAHLVVVDGEELSDEAAA